MKLKSFLKTTCIHSIENTCASTHVLLVLTGKILNYAGNKVIQSVEWTEKKSINKLEPERAEIDIVKERRASTNRFIHEAQQEINRIATDIKDLAECDDEAMEVLHETEQHGG